MKKVQVRDKRFKMSIEYSEIHAQSLRMAKEIKKEYAKKNPLFVSVLNGAFLFAAELFKEIDFPCEITFTRLASYHGTGSTGKIRTLIPLAESVTGRHVIILEDIVDSGLTLSHLIKVLKKQKPASIKTACMLFKPEALQHKLTLDYVGFEVPNDFLVGFGLDYDGHGRNLKDIYTLVK